MSAIGTSLTIAYSPFLSGSCLSSDREDTLSNFLFSLEPLSRTKVDQVAASTFPLFNQLGNYVGNCVAIGRKIVLASGHCVDQQGVCVGNMGSAKVIFDGSNHGGFENLDFKILYVAKGSFKPVNLSVTTGCGLSIQTYYKSNKRGQLIQFIKSFESDSGPYAQRSDLASVKTDRGESGAPRMSLLDGSVFAIHQGESEGLKMNDIYHALESASSNSVHPQRLAARYILQNIHVSDLNMRYLNWSSVGLMQGIVHEEMPRVHGDVSFLVSSKGKQVKFVFSYHEVG